MGHRKLRGFRRRRRASDLHTCQAAGFRPAGRGGVHRTGYRAGCRVAATLQPARARGCAVPCQRGRQDRADRHRGADRPAAADGAGRRNGGAPGGPTRLVGRAGGLVQTLRLARRPRGRRGRHDDQPPRCCGEAGAARPTLAIPDIRRATSAGPGAAHAVRQCGAGCNVRPDPASDASGQRRHPGARRPARGPSDRCAVARRAGKADGNRAGRRPGGGQLWAGAGAGAPAGQRSPA